MTRPYRPDHRGPVFNFFWPFTSYVIAHLTTALGAILFFGLNRTTVIGRSNVPRQRNTLLLSNHQSLIDSFFIGFAAFFGPSFFKPYLIPWNPAGEEYFYRNAWQSWWSDQWRCIPVRRRRRDIGALNRMLHALKSGTMVLFPEGTRSRTGSIEKGRPGAGIVVLPVGASFPRLFKRIYVVYGKPIDYTPFLTENASRESAQRIVDHTMDILRRQMDWIERLKAGEVSKHDPPWGD